MEHNPTLEFADGTRYNGEGWNSLSWRTKTYRTLQLRARILKKDIGEWTDEERDIITHYANFHAYKNSWGFELLFGVIVILNTFIMALKVDAEDSDADGFAYAEHAFCFFFLLEWCAQIFIEGFLWLAQGMAIFETALVWIGGVLPVWVMPSAGASGGFWSKVGGVFTIFRVLRIFRIWRLVKKTKQKDLWMLIVGVMDSFKSFLWAMALFVAFLFVSSIFLRFVVGNDDSVMSTDTTGDLDRYLGSVPRTMWFLFAAFTGGVSWEAIVHQIMDVEPSYWLYFAVFVCLGEFIMLNLITAVIVEHAIDDAQIELEHEAHEKEQERSRIIERVIEIFKDCDQNGDGTVDRKEFIKMCSGRAMQRLQRLLQLDEAGRDLLDLFDLIDLDGSGSCSLEEYRDVLFKVLQEPRSKEMLTILSCTKKSDHHLQLLAQQGNPLQPISGRVQTDDKGSMQESELLVAVKALTQKLSSIDGLTERIGLVEGQMGQMSGEVGKILEEIGTVRRLRSSGRCAS